MAWGKAVTRSRRTDGAALGFFTARRVVLNVVPGLASRCFVRFPGHAASARGPRLKPILRPYMGKQGLLRTSRASAPVYRIGVLHHDAERVAHLSAVTWRTTWAIRHSGWARVVSLQAAGFAARPRRHLSDRSSQAHPDQQYAGHRRSARRHGLQRRLAVIHCAGRRARLFSLCDAPRHPGLAARSYAAQHGRLEHRRAFRGSGRGRGDRAVARRAGGGSIRPARDLLFLEGTIGVATLSSAVPRNCQPKLWQGPR